MMNETLQKELSKHLRKIKGRKHFIEKWEEKMKMKEDLFGRSFEGKEELIKLTHLKAKTFLDKIGFNYEKDGNSAGDRIIWKDGFLRMRRYNHRYWNTINLDYNQNINEFLPDGFQEALNLFNKKRIKIGEIKICFKSLIKFNKGIDIQFIDKYDKELLTDKVIKIELKGGDVSVDGINHNPNEDSYYNDFIFKKILNLMKRYERNLDNLTKVRGKMINEVKGFMGSKFDKIVLVANLEEE